MTLAESRLMGPSPAGALECGDLSLRQSRAGRLVELALQALCLLVFPRRQAASPRWTRGWLGDKSPTAKSGDESPHSKGLTPRLAATPENGQVQLTVSGNQGSRHAIERAHAAVSRFSLDSAISFNRR